MVGSSRAKAINKMKKIMLFALAFTLIMPCTISAQSAAERQEAAKKELKAKVSRSTKKDARKFQAEGWKVSPGALPLERQLEKSYLMQYQYDDNGYPLYLVGEGRSIAGNYDAAKMQALALAKQNLAGTIETEVKALIESTIANKQISEEDAVSLTETVEASKSRIVQKLGQVITVVETYRVTSNKNKEVLVRIAYNGKLAREAAKKAMEQELKEKGLDLHAELDQVPFESE